MNKAVSNLMAISFLACIALYFLARTKKCKSNWGFHFFYAVMAGVLTATQLYLAVFGPNKIISVIFSVLCLYGTVKCYNNFQRVYTLNQYIKQTEKKKAKKKPASVIDMNKYKN